MDKEKRLNGTGTAIEIKDCRRKPWIARILIGKDINGKAIYYDIATFESKFKALVCLENYHENPHPLEIEENKYNRIVTFPKKPYPLVSVANPKKNLIEKTKKDNYTFKQIYEEFKEMKLPNKEERNLEKKHHIKPKNKLALNTAKTMITAFNNSTALYDKVYRELRTSDFQKTLNDCEKSFKTIEQMISLYNKLDSYALEEGFIERGYAQNISVSTTKEPTKRKKEKEVPFTYKQIEYLWNFKPKSKKESISKKEELVRDIWLSGIYTGARAEELCFIYTKNIFLDENYFIGGLKTRAGINREIPIHPNIKHIFEKYYDTNNEFLFMQPKGKRVDYDYYERCYRLIFKNLHPAVSTHTAHDARHTLRDELRKLNIKEIIINSLLGHTNGDTGQDVYSHVSIKEKLKAVKMITYKESKKLYVMNSKIS